MTRELPLVTGAAGAFAGAPARPTLQRARGAVRIAFKRLGARTVLQDLYQKGSLKARLPSTVGHRQEAVLINTAGGIAGGDELDIAVKWEAGTTAFLTTQAAERVYRSTGDDGVITTRLDLHEDAHGLWLPQETILFDGGRLRRRTHATLAPSARLLAIEAIIIGRPAMAETVRTAVLGEEWVIERGGRTVFIDRMRLEGDIGFELDRAGGGNGARAFASLLAVGDDSAAQCELARCIIANYASIKGFAGGSSDLGGVCLTRLVARSGHELRRVTSALLVALGGADLPRVWTM